MNRHEFPDAESCAAALARALAGAVGDALAVKSRAALALSGGRSPEAVLPLLASADVDWSLVDVTLVDDRRVPEGDPQSNAGLVRRCFLDRGAARAAFVPLWPGGTDLEAALIDTGKRLRPVLPVDVAYLGMGPDGHIASLFPADDLRNFERDGSAVISSEAPSAPHGRVSLTLSELIRIPRLFLHVTDAGKIDALNRGLSNPPTPTLPVSLLLNARPDIDAFICH